MHQDSLNGSFTNKYNTLNKSKGEEFFTYGNQTLVKYAPSEGNNRGQGGSLMARAHDNFAKSEIDKLSIKKSELEDDDDIELAR